MRKRHILRGLARLRRLLGCRDAESRRRVGMTAFCALVGLLCNFAPYDARPGVSVTFGGAAALTAALLMGPWYGAIAAVVANLAFLLPGHHLMEMVVGVLEAVLIGALSRRLKKDDSSETLFWASLSSTVVTALGMSALGHGGPWLILLKAPVNSLVNLALAILAITLLRAWWKPWRSWRYAGERALPLRSIRTYLFVVTILAALAPLAILFIEQGKKLERDRKSEVSAVQAVASQQAAREVGLTIRRYRQLVISVAGELDRVSTWQDRSSMEEILERFRTINPEFLTMLVATQEGQIAAVSPRFTANGQRMMVLGLSVADRDYFRNPRETGLPYLSGGFQGRGMGTDRIAAISAPIQNVDGKFHGVVEASISLDRFTLPDRVLDSSRQTALVLLDQQGTVLSATPESGFRPLDTAGNKPELQPLFQSGSPVSGTMEIAGHLVSRQPVESTGWILVVRRPLDSIAQEMDSYYRATGLGMALAAVACLFLIRLIAPVITRPIDDMLHNVRTFSLTSPTPQEVVLSRLAPREVEELAGDFVRMSDGLAASYSDLTDSLEERLRLNQELTRMVSEMKMKTAELAEAKTRSEEAIRLKSAFLSNISHEVRTPLNGLMGMLTILLDGPLEDDQRRKACIAQESATSLMSLVSDLLNFSALAGGTTEVETIEFYPSAVVDAVVSLSQRHAVEKDVKLLSYVDPKAKRKHRGDPGKLRQALSHLVQNALKFTSRGSVRVAVTCKQEGPDSRTFRYEVSDTGIGIPREQLDRIFEPFTQADGSMTRRHGGAGLGLAVVKQIVDRLGGTMGVKSEEGIGSVFWITLELPLVPAVDLSKVASAEPAGAKPVGERPRRVLVVEDNAVNQKVVCRLLQKVGFEVQVAGDGREALSEIERHGPFEAILMDCQMPVMDGYEATAEIRRREGELRHTPIIATTAHAMEGDREKCLRAGMDDYVTKPIDRDTLLDVLARYTTVPVGVK